MSIRGSFLTKPEKAELLDILHFEMINQEPANLGLSSSCAIIWFSVTCLVEKVLCFPMTNEEMQKMMEFILEHQAQFAVNIQRLQEERLADQPRLARLEESFQLLVQLARKHGFVV